MALDGFPKRQSTNKRLIIDRPDSSLVEWLAKWRPNRTVTVINPLLWSIYIVARSLVVDRGELDTPAKTCIQSKRPRVITDLITRPLITTIISDRCREIC